MPAGRQHVTKLTDSTGGVVSATETVVDVPGTYTEATLAAQLATIIAKVNELVEVVGGKAD